MPAIARGFSLLHNGIARSSDSAICQEKGWPEPQYLVRPPLGLRLEAQGDGVPMTVALRPGWRKATKYYDRPAEPGVVRTEKAKTEVLGDPKKGQPVLLHLDLYEGQPPKLRSLCCEDALRKASLRALETKAHDLLADPMRLFSEQADRRRL